MGKGTVFFFYYVIYLQGNNIFIYAVFTVKGNFFIFLFMVYLQGKGIVYFFLIYGLFTGNYFYLWYIYREFYFLFMVYLQVNNMVHVYFIYDVIYR